VHNPEINWETGEVKMTRCLPLCGRNLAVKEDIEQRKKIGKRIRNMEKCKGIAYSSLDNLVWVSII